MEVLAINPRPSVLFVDDDPSVLANVRRGLWREPLEVLTAPSATAALAILRERSIDVVVSDEKMPGMGGAELLTVVRQLHPEVCRVLLSGQADVDAALRAINEARVFRFLTKPCPPQDLASCITEALAAREQRRELERGFHDARKANQARAALLAEALPKLWIAIQPIVHAHGGALYAYEALARCDHPGIGGPMALFDLAEEQDAVVAVERVLRTRVGELLRTLPPEIPLFVNTHPRALDDDEFYDERNPLVAHAPRVVLELIERETITGDERLAARIASLRAHGFRVAIDDLGAGYNGLNAFAELSPDIVKFDMALCREVVRGGVRARLVAAVAEVCRDLGILTVAEGIETDEQARAMTDFGCDLLQGYLFGHPKRPTRELRLISG
ncbi:MAG: EAL domain-containing protein [Deltaproteobacteria bacterium]|nr:EAL domain-containing protein [Deltaproteobacteria bacterium]MBK8714587.1 EAL domain-containing protein [Deltaproteobacteria bacterium]MBP7290030.1 EAL domain-containing protein [Nannocystaceae bacterium]